MAGKNRNTQEFGDFQTPPQLAGEVCRLLAEKGLAPASVLEPTCGQGNFLSAALRTFPTIRNAVGIDVNSDYIALARSDLQSVDDGTALDIRQEDFFAVDWNRLLDCLPEPLLVLGNPPWVTNSVLSSLDSANLPEKSNFQRRRGIDAITGKSNFDISEWMLLQALDWIDGKRAAMAMLCKTSVARKVLAHAWKRHNPMIEAEIYRIDAAANFGVAVDSCLLVIAATPSAQPPCCRVHDSLDALSKATVLGYENGRLLADVTAYAAWRHLEGKGPGKWRSGIKHDCSRVMELREIDGRYRNLLGETVSLERNYLYPMLKSSDLSHPGEINPSRYMLVPQRFVGESTEPIEKRAPQTWQYLVSHAAYFERRASSIYRNRPRFSIFGVGEYSFAPWKVAVSGFYKNLRFRVVGPSSGKPIVFDDTCYFLPCRSQEEAIATADMLNSQVAREFFSAFAFWDAKRPVTVELLHRLDLAALARELGRDMPNHVHQPSLI